MDKINQLYENAKKENINKFINSFSIYKQLNIVFANESLNNLYCVKDYLEHKKMKISLFNNIFSFFQSIFESLIYFLLLFLLNQNGKLDLKGKVINISTALPTRVVRDWGHIVQKIWNGFFTIQNADMFFLIIYVGLVIVMVFLGSWLRKVREENIRQLILKIVNREINKKEKDI